MDRPTNIFSARPPYAAEGLHGKCGYCRRKLASVAFIYARAQPACGSAWCLQQALLDSTRELAA